MLAGAAAAGIPFCLSTSSSMTLEEVAAAAPDAERWFQLYVVGGMRLQPRRSSSAPRPPGYRAIVLTVDLPVLGRRERDVRSGFAAAGHAPRRRGRRRWRATATAALEDQRTRGSPGSRVAEIRSWSSLPLVLKGILSPDDARLRRGGRRGRRSSSRPTAAASSTARSRPSTRCRPIVEAVAGRCEVWVDGGIRRGLDVAGGARARRDAASSSGGRSTGRSPPAAAPASSAPPRSCGRSWSSRCRCSAVASIGGGRRPDLLAHEVLARVDAAPRRSLPGVAAQPIQDVPPQRVAHREPRVIEVVGRVSGHPEPLHHRRDRTFAATVNETISASPRTSNPNVERRRRRLRRVAVAPGVAREPPADLDRGREMRLERRASRGR